MVVDVDVLTIAIEVSLQYIPYKSYLFDFCSFVCFAGIERTPKVSV